MGIRCKTWRSGCMLLGWAWIFSWADHWIVMGACSPKTGRVLPKERKRRAKMEERLQKLLSRCGVASRRAAERMIAEGRVTVNGAVARLGQTADETRDVVAVDGIPVRTEPPKLYIMLNKPRGYVTTLRDEKGRNTVAELVAGCGQRVYPVGRLDMDSEGLLLLTNDGALANRLMHPSHEVDKTYLVWTAGAPPDAAQRLSRPMELDGVQLKPARVRELKRTPRQTVFEMTIHEGRNRQIRRMCELCGMRVIRLRRIAEGPVRLGSLEPGKWRHLTRQELQLLQIHQSEVHKNERNVSNTCK